MIKEKQKIDEKEDVNMILSLNEGVRKQAKNVSKQAKELRALLNSEEICAEYDTNAVLIQMDKIENELSALRDLINREKEQAYIEKLQGTSPRRPENAPSAARAEIAEKSKKIEKPEKTEKEQKNNKPEKADKPKKSDKSGKKEKKDDKPGKKEKEKKSDKSEKAEKKIKKKKKDDKKH